MDRLQKNEYLKLQGYKYDSDTGNIYNVKGKVITAKTTSGYIYLKIKKKFNIFAHHYAYFMTYGNVDFTMLDHINRDRSDNRICNLRIVTQQENNNNQYGKGYSKCGDKWKAYIKINYKQKHLGLFNTQQEAHNAYLNAKQQYHQA